jgi:hypothetical protein
MVPWRVFRQESVSPGQAFSLKNDDYTTVVRMRGKRPVISLASAKKFAERQGYCWISNPETEIPFDAILYRANDVIALRVRTSRNAPGEFDLYEDFFRKDCDILQDLPLPPHIARELWVRFVWSRAFQRFRLSNEKLHLLTMVDRNKPVFRPGLNGGIPSSPKKKGDDLN